MGIKHYSALGTINTPRGRKMTIDDLKAALDNQAIVAIWKSHLRALFEEVSPQAIGTIVRNERLDPAKLLAIADQVEPHANTVQPYLERLRRQGS